jgi:crotonobetainyl-CoA:carnitine CoA-transferase CaiB-like acyl-CoA transferase
LTGQDGPHQTAGRSDSRPPDGQQAVAGGVVPYRMGNAHPSLFPYEPLPTRDGELIVTAASDPRFDRAEDRTAHRDELKPLLIERLCLRTAAEWFPDLIAAGVPCGPINTVAGGVGFAAEVGLEPVQMAGQGDSAVPSVRHPLAFSRTPPRYDLPPPRLDEHGTQIRAWLASRPTESR